MNGDTGDIDDAGNALLDTCKSMLAVKGQWGSKRTFDSSEIVNITRFWCAVR